MRSDFELLRSYASEQSNVAFAELVQRHLPVVYHAALRRLNGNAHLAEEACQLVFTQLARKASRLARHPVLLGWLHTSTRYAAGALLRRERRRALRERLAGTMTLDDANEADSISWETLRPLVDEALDQLGTVDRQAVLLRFFAGRSFAEIGVELNLSEEASRKRVDRALEKLRQRFAHRGVTTSSAALAAALAQSPAAAAAPPVTLAATVTAAATSAAGGGSLAAAVLAAFGAVKLTNITIGVAAAGVIGLGTALVTWSNIQREREQQLAAIEAQTTSVHARLRELTREAITKAASRGRDSSAPARVATPDKFVEENLRIRRILSGSPEYAAMHREELTLRAEREIGAWCASRNLSPEQARAVREALVAAYLAQEEEWDASARAPAGTRKRPDLATTERVRQITAALDPLLGPDEIEQVRRRFEARNWRRPAKNVAADLADAGLPISPAEELSLAAVMADAWIPDPAARRAAEATIDPATGLSADERAQLDDAAAFLRLEQVKIFEQFLRDERARTELTRRARAELANRAGG